MNAEEVIQRGLDYQRMADTEGFKHLRQTLEKVIDGAKDQWLESDSNSDKIKVYAKAFKRVLSLVDNKIALGKKAAERPSKAIPKARARKRKVIV